MGIAIYTFRSPLELLSISYVCHFAPPPPTATSLSAEEPAPTAARSAAVIPLPLAATQPPGTAPAPPGAQVHAQLAEMELESLEGA